MLKTQRAHVKLAVMEEVLSEARGRIGSQDQLARKNSAAELMKLSELTGCVVSNVDVSGFEHALVEPVNA